MPKAHSLSLLHYYRYDKEDWETLTLKAIRELLKSAMRKVNKNDFRARSRNQIIRGLFIKKLLECLKA